MIKVHNSLKAPEGTLKVTLVSGKPEAPYAKDSKFAASKDGFLVFVEKDDFKWYQMAARTVASLCLETFLLVTDDALTFTKKELYWFLTALYDGTHDYDVYTAFDDVTLEEVHNTLETVSDFRALADTDSKVSTPLSVVNAVFAKIKAAADLKGDKVSLKLIKRGDAEFETFTGLKAVGLASFEDPCMGIIDFIPSSMTEDSPVQIGLVGKGITFDTGGYSLKPEKFMETMRTDKTAVIYLSGALTLAILKGLKKHVRLYLCCSENMVSGRGMLPGDILTYPNGTKVEINNTDAEGRLVLADGLLKACEDKAEFILDMATLTGAAKVAVGRDMFTVITRDSELNPSLKKAFDENDEMYWQLPLASYHRRFLSSTRADMTNSGHGDGAPGSSVAASFLSEFVNRDIPWVHIDLSSAYLPSGSPFLACGPTGSTILGLSEFLRS
ncbi:MAG: hypothetical protein IJ671_01455 [Succinivibrio sp.]|jgi:PepB aminopeptidase|nr:hypothetical protein [Succinivibrio sp.]